MWTGSQKWFSFISPQNALVILSRYLRSSFSSLSSMNFPIYSSNSSFCSGIRHFTWKRFDACSFMNIVSLVRHRTNSYISSSFSVSAAYRFHRGNVFAEQLGSLHQHIVVRRKAVSALQKYTLQSAEIHRYLLDIRFDLLYGRLAEFSVLEIGAEQAVIVGTALCCL